MNVEQLLKTKGGEATIIGPEKTIGATARLLAERNKGLALVCSAEDKLLGVVSVIDISRAVGEHGERAPGMAVESIMTTNFAFCRIKDSDETDLPDPDSPTTQTVSPGLMLNDATPSFSQNSRMKPFCGSVVITRCSRHLSPTFCFSKSRITRN